MRVALCKIDNRGYKNHGGETLGPILETPESKNRIKNLNFII